MFPGTDTTAYDTAAEVAAYKKVAGNVFYKAGIGMLGGYMGWSFYAKQANASDFTTMADPLYCDLTMSTAYDANSGSEYNGAKFSLTLYNGYTQGLSWSLITTGSSTVGTNDINVPAPQIANGAVCGDYLLKSTFTRIVPDVLNDTDCSATWSSLTDPGALPTSAVAYDHWNITIPSTTLMCWSDNNPLNAIGCTFI